MLEIILWCSIGMILYSYLLYPLLLRCTKQTRHDTAAMYAASWPSVSLLVSAYNEEKIIRQKIENLLSLDYPEALREIVIVSDCSSDSTDAIVAQYASRGVLLRRQEKRSGKVNAINQVTPLLKGEFVVYSDANTIMEPDAVKKLVRHFADPSIGAVCGQLVYRNEATNEVEKLEGAYWRYEQFLKRREGSVGSLLGANGGIYAIRRGLFAPVPADTIIEDFVIPMKILERGYKVIYESEAVGYEETAKEVAHEMERRIRIGAGDFQALALTWKVLDPARGFSALAYFSHKVLRWLTPFLLPVILVLCVFLAGRSPYRELLILQGAFYSCAALGWLVSKLRVRTGVFGLPYYFTAMNAALFLGFMRFCRNSQQVTWKRTER